MRKFLLAAAAAMGLAGSADAATVTYDYYADPLSLQIHINSTGSGYETYSFETPIWSYGKNVTITFYENRTNVSDYFQDLVVKINGTSYAASNSTGGAWSLSFDLFDNLPTQIELSFNDILAGSAFGFISVVAVPAPATAALLPLGVGALALARRRRVKPRATL